MTSIDKINLDEKLARFSTYWDPIEEAALAEQFGQAYAEYQRRVRRWL